MCTLTDKSRFGRLSMKKSLCIDHLFQKIVLMQE